MAVMQAPRQQSNWGGIISTLVSMMPGMQWVAPAYAAANGIASGNPGQIASGIAGGVGQMQAPTPDAGGGMVAPAFTGGPDATDRMQMNKGLLQQQQTPALAPDATDRMQMNKRLLQEQQTPALAPDATDRMLMNKRLMDEQINSRYNQILGQYGITPEGPVDQSKWDGLMRTYPSIFGYQRGR